VVPFAFSPLSKRNVNSFYVSLFRTSSIFTILFYGIASAVVYFVRGGHVLFFASAELYLFVIGGFPERHPFSAAVW